MSKEMKFNNKEVVYQGKFIGIEKREFCLPTGETQVHEVMLKKDVVAILAVTAENKIYFTVQPRAGKADMESLEIPAGTVEQGEDKFEAAKRELLEETGCESEEWIELGHFYGDPACCNSRTTLYYANNCKKTSEQNLDEGEYLNLSLINISDLPKYISSGKIEDANSLTAILLAKLMK